MPPHVHTCHGRQPESHPLVALSTLNVVFRVPFAEVLVAGAGSMGGFPAR